MEGLLVASFIMTHEDRYWKRKCVIRDCEHRIGPDVTKPMWASRWNDEVCHPTGTPAWVVHEDNIDEPIGIACHHHVEEILEGVK